MQDFRSKENKRRMQAAFARRFLPAHGQLRLFVKSVQSLDLCHISTSANQCAHVSAQRNPILHRVVQKRCPPTYARCLNIPQTSPLVGSVPPPRAPRIPPLFEDPAWCELPSVFGMSEAENRADYVLHRSRDPPRPLLPAPPTTSPPPNLHRKPKASKTAEKSRLLVPRPAHRPHPDEGTRLTAPHRNKTERTLEPCSLLPLSPLPLPPTRHPAPALQELNTRIRIPTSHPPTHHAPRPAEQSRPVSSHPITTLFSTFDIQTMSAPTNTTSTTSPIETEPPTPASPASPLKTELGIMTGSGPPKRKTARRANTAERRATHNAVERIRRDALNGRFLTLASLLPPLAMLRRPSKAAIVSSRREQSRVRGVDTSSSMSMLWPSAVGRAAFLARDVSAMAAADLTPRTRSTARWTRASRFSPSLALCRGFTVVDPPQPGPAAPGAHLPFSRPESVADAGVTIATVHAARRHRVLAAQTLRALGREAEGLRREVNEWRLRARVPPLAAPPRSDAHVAILRAEVEDFDLALEEGLDLEEDGEDEDGKEDAPAPSPAHSSSSPTHESAPPRSAASSHGQAQARARSGSVKQQHQERFAFEAPSTPSPASPSSSSNASSEGPGTPPASAGAHMSASALLPMRGALPMSMAQQPQMELEMQGMHPYDQMQMQMRARAASASAPIQIPMTKRAGYEAALHGGGGAGYELDLNLGLGLGLGLAASASPAEEMMMMGMDGGGWASASPQHPAFNAHARQQQQQMQLQELQRQQAQNQQYLAQQQQMMMMGVQGVQFGQYLHQPGAFA
ncbi:hypothetical protein B0H17DRAFT_1255718 [Mycena rosella]|uniref:BHLH domain-containing protein n=1 Tax=Mycena rosella TaxID=1033263 RepID=A0AAD7GNP6_MYCRO|nr:hypothetical protein B0H17DRAFT_1255718 [Mycena rosella]